ncbi:hypothetical protein DPMN_046145 [Dreissena polymorpha]|uniref:Uncharacterized protein n=1 Tax=Dreissena polymorpha TaxID=45954 RepID=A0A9D4I0C3_DREPO|nr:hypothetical protein DPMN_046145 [Dreissena polymorpha]
MDGGTTSNKPWTKPTTLAMQKESRGRPELIDRIVITDVQYQFEVNRYNNEEINFQGSSANSVGGDSGQDGRTDCGDNDITSTFSPKSVGIISIVVNNFIAVLS